MCVRQRDYVIYEHRDETREQRSRLGGRTRGRRPPVEARVGGMMISTALVLAGSLLMTSSAPEEALPSRRSRRMSR